MLRENGALLFTATFQARLVKNRNISAKTRLKCVGFQQEEQ